MGACFSKNKSRGPPTPGSAPICPDGRMQPPPETESLLEETVKEVLSETPKPKALRPSREEDVIIEKKGGDETMLAGEGRDDKSEVTSEVCSVSESLSVSTTLTEVTVEERLPSASPVKFQRKRTSSSSDILLKREMMTGSIASAGCSRRSSPSPAKHREGGGARRMSSVREAPMAGKSSVGVVRRALCRDPGERSGRRSTSPAAKRTLAGQCRSVSMTMVNGRSSPQRVGGSGVLERARCGSERRKLALDMVECGVGAESAGGLEGKETLENPLVSLECFIFL